jgi:two-component system sensor histidine kinase AlgZ
MQDTTNNAGCFLPDFCDIRIVFAVVIAAELLALVISMASYTSANSFWTELGMLSLFIQWIALGSSSSFCVLRPLLRKMGPGLSGSLALAMVLLVTVLVTALACQQGLNSGSCSRLFMQSLSISFIIGVLSLHYFYLQHRLNLQQQAEANARFQALQARIRPHFLFNSMNTIAHLTREDAEMAERVTEDLAELFRAALSESNQVTTLEKEIELATGYLNIEQLRLGKRLAVNWQMDEKVEHLKSKISMPAMTLQPLLENAIYHGIEPVAEGGKINIRGMLSESQVILEIDNPLPLNSQGGHRKGNRMAQDNISQRFATIYENEAIINFQENGGRYSVIMKIPLGKLQ